VAHCLLQYQIFLSNPPEIITEDIDHFWEAYDSLANSKDPIKTIQSLYKEKWSEHQSAIDEIVKESIPVN
jgi:hypothetical protein